MIKSQQFDIHFDNTAKYAPWSNKILHLHSQNSFNSATTKLWQQCSADKNFGPLDSFPSSITWQRTQSATYCLVEHGGKTKR
jgi:hypothetical protein